MSYSRTKAHRQKMKKAKAGTIKYWQSGGEFKKGQISWNKGKHLSKGTKRKIGLKSRGKHYGIGAFGEKNPAWSGGISPLRKRIRSCGKYKTWRNNVLKRDGNICRLCKCKSKVLDVNHVIPFSFIFKFHEIDSFEKAMQCKDLWKVKNGIVLCRKCHDEYGSAGTRNFNATLKL